MPLPEPASTAGELIERVAAHLPTTGRLGIAYSGGVDSATLLAIAHHVLGPERTLAIMAVSPSLASREKAMALDTAEFIGAQVIQIQTDEQAVQGYRVNDVDRCYFCKNEMFERIDEGVVDKHNLAAIAYGENADDSKRIDRPGARAATEHGVLRPLSEAGLSKADVRAVARAFQLPVADKPAAPCLASRIPHGHEVTEAKLKQIEAVELMLYQLGFSDSRVRHHGDIARIELLIHEMSRATAPEVAREIEAAATRAGFKYAVVDLRGIQSGAMTLSILNAKGTL
ncbi:Asparagine synthase [Corynebacterium faecale]|uniref:ATP-dependent sacrificial sulfur transferase LarE n=1 Tax=Corynebacterium faecale TaxID=1758466 RepID=UPI0025B44487|nr:ATP-dependent sacrificial sulfur transferase LarE [Corynebacterium faecale]WJY92965.1 Asparagine synthase [Corynebacterium faecale]